MANGFSAGGAGFGALAGGLLSGLGGLLSKSSAKRRRKRFKRFAAAVLKSAEQKQELARRRFLESPTVGIGQAFLLSRFLNPLGGRNVGAEDIFGAFIGQDTPRAGDAESQASLRDIPAAERRRFSRLASRTAQLSQLVPDFGGEFQNRIRTAQAARGFVGGGGGAGSSQEAAFVGRIAETQRQQLFPFLGRFEQLAQQAGINAFNQALTPLGIFQAAPQVPSSGDVLSSVVSGTLGGGLIGGQFGNLFGGDGDGDGVSSRRASNLSPVFSPTGTEDELRRLVFA